MNNLIRVAGLIGDVHAEHVLLERAIQYLSDKVDSFLAVGDIVDGMGDADRCCDLLREVQAHAVRGNHERWFLKDEMRVLSDAHFKDKLRPDTVQWLEGLPVNVDLDCVGGRLLLCHGIGKNDMAEINPDDYGREIEFNPDLETLVYASGYRYVVNGHSHRRLVRKIDKITFINAGTLRRRNDPCFGLANFEARTVQFFDLNDEGFTPTEVRVLP